MAPGVQAGEFDLLVGVDTVDTECELSGFFSVSPSVRLIPLLGHVFTSITEGWEESATEGDGTGSPRDIPAVQGHGALGSRRSA
jgi:hypothetical protein